MRIWIVHHYALPPDRPGGTRHWSVAQELCRRGHDVLLVAAGLHYQTGTDSTDYDANGERAEAFGPVRFLWLRTLVHRGNSVRRLLNLVSFWRAVRRSPTLAAEPRPDLVLGSSPQPFAALAGLQLARRFRVPFVYEVRDLWPQALVDGGHFSPKHPLVVLFKRIQRRCLRGASRVITLLPASTAYLEAHGAPRGSVACVPNGTDLDVAVPGPTPASGDAPVFLYAGAQGTANGLENVIAAAAMLMRAEGLRAPRVVLVGEGPETARLRELASASGAANVSFRPPVPKAEVYGTLAEADCFIMVLADSKVLRWGISPNKLFDYLAMGRPVLFAVRAGNNPVEDAGAGISADPRSPESIAAAMRALAALDPDARASMGRRGREYVERHHDLRMLTRRYADLLESSAGAADLSDGRSS